MTIYESLHSIPIDALAEKVGGRNRLTRLVSLRLRALNAGAPLLVERQTGEALLAAVCREVQEGKIWLEVQEEQVASPAGGIDDLLNMDGVGDEAAVEA